ncbi:acyl-CoA dehydrogenase family protein, partial [Klebsiella pneumoniae]|uniref:acyl-CoA dehydrogenase family protein n=1 Tax=Klebsiella pneumoniae TaxID=573 RepID=UPI0034D2226E
MDDRAVRSKLATWAVRDSGLRYTAYRSISALSRGARPGPENSNGKLVGGPTLQEISAKALEMQGAAGQLSGDSAALAGQFQTML